MSFWKKLFGGGPDAALTAQTAQPSAAPSNSLVAKLISTHDRTFEIGLNEAVSLVKRGDEAGLQAIREAIISLSGQPDFTSYKRGMVLLSGAAAAAEYFDARAGLLDFAARKEFLKDPKKTQQLITAFQVVNRGQQDFTRLIDDVYRVGGSSEAHALLLLYNEIWAVQLLRKVKP
jgi:hypothetical protein